MSEREIDAVEPGGSGAVPLPALSPGVGGGSGAALPVPGCVGTPFALGGGE